MAVGDDWKISEKKNFIYWETTGKARDMSSTKWEKSGNLSTDFHLRFYLDKDEDGMEEKGFSAATGFRRYLPRNWCAG